MRKIRFTKSVASGNDFIILDRMSFDLRLTNSELANLAKESCQRKWSIGADGLLVLEKSRKADFRMRIFNPDSSEVTMCGNGSRCVALYARDKKIANAKMRIEVGAGILEVHVRGDTIRTRFTDPKDIRWNFCLSIHNCPYQVSFVDTGVPHVVHFAKDIANLDIKSLGRAIRYHEEFSPQGSNADFVEVIDKSRIRVRTYERGVEDETLACGTGAVASAIIAAESEKMNSPIAVEMMNGETLKVYFSKESGKFKDVYLEGKARLVYEGDVIFNIDKRA